MSPLAIYQSALDSVSHAVLEGDFESYAALIDLPYLVHTETALILVSTEAELRPTFDALHQGLRKRSVTHYERLARKASYCSSDRIEGWHYTHMLSNGSYALPTRPARQTIVRRSGTWRFSEARYPILASTWPMTDAAIFDDPVHATHSGSFGQ
jgi:hypothetical protein